MFKNKLSYFLTNVNWKGNWDLLRQYLCYSILWWFDSRCMTTPALMEKLSISLSRLPAQVATTHERQCQGETWSKCDYNKNGTCIFIILKQTHLKTVVGYCLLIIFFCSISIDTHIKYTMFTAQHKMSLLCPLCGETLLIIDWWKRSSLED